MSQAALQVARVEGGEVGGASKATTHVSQSQGLPVLLVQMTSLHRVGQIIRGWIEYGPLPVAPIVESRVAQFA